MIRVTRPVLLTALLSACVGPGAGGQSTAAPDPSLTRMHAYEVPTTPTGQAQETPEIGPGWIQVGGSAQVEVEPDRAHVTFAVETRGGTAGDAAAANADAMDAVLTALREAGFEGLDLATHGYALRPEYSNQNNQRTREIVAYIALNNVRATVSDVGAVGRVIDRAIGAGANRVAGIGFFAADTGPARAQALALAVDNAREQAEIIATSLGYELGAPLEVNGGAQRPGPVPYQAEMMTMRAADTPIEAGDQTVSANVSVRFAIGRESGG